MKNIPGVKTNAELNKRLAEVIELLAADGSNDVSNAELILLDGMTSVNQGDNVSTVFATTGYVDENGINSSIVIDDSDSPYTALRHTTIVADSSSGAVTVTLPEISASNVGKTYKIYRSGAANRVSVAAGGTDTFLDSAGSSSLDIDVDKNWLKVQAVDDGASISGWVILEEGLSPIAIYTHSASPLTVRKEKAIIADSSSGAVVINLPTIVGNLGMKIRIHRSGANLVTINADGAEVFVDSSASARTLPHTGNYVELMAVSDGGSIVGWQVLSEDISNPTAYNFYATGDSPVTAATENFIIADSSGGAVVVNLPAVAGVLGRRFEIHRNGAGNNVTVNADGTETFLDDGSSAKTLTSNFNMIEVMAVSDGGSLVGWQVIRSVIT